MVSQRYYYLLPEQVLSAQFPSPSKLCEVDICAPLTLPLPLGPDAATVCAPLCEDVLAAKKGEPPLHAVAPFFELVTQLACALCIIIVLTTTTAAVTRASVTAAIAAVNTTLLVVLEFEFAVIAI
jgi:hypothetical protein